MIKKIEKKIDSFNIGTNFPRCQSLPGIECAVNDIDFENKLKRKTIAGEWNDFFKNRMPINLDYLANHSSVVGSIHPMLQKCGFPFVANLS